MNMFPSSSVNERSFPNILSHGAQRDLYGDPLRSLPFWAGGIALMICAASVKAMYRSLSPNTWAAMAFAIR